MSPDSLGTLSMLLLRYDTPWALETKGLLAEAGGKIKKPALLVTMNEFTLLQTCGFVRS
jgi:hypothetical protein